MGNPSNCKVDLTLCSQTGGVGLSSLRSPSSSPSLRPAPIPPVRRGSLRNRELQIYNATVKMGADGTDDDVTVGICSDSKTDCCQKKLSRTLSDDWNRTRWKIGRRTNLAIVERMERSTGAPQCPACTSLRMAR